MADTPTEFLWAIVALFVAGAFAIGIHGGDPTVLTGLFTSVFTIAVFGVLAWRFTEAIDG